MKRYMKPIYWLSFILICSFAVSSCSEDMMDDINKNLNNPSDVESRFLITNVMLSTSLSVIGSDLNFYASVYMEHHVGVGNQMHNAEIRSGEPYNSATYNNQWNNMYDNLSNLRVIINKCSEGGSESGNYHTLGAAQVLSALNLATLTDCMGDVPWAEALQPGVIFTPKLDKQEEIYKVINKFLDDAIVNLQKESNYASLGAQDFLFGGDAAKWLKFANGLKARYTMRVAVRNANYADVLTYAGKSYTGTAEEAAFPFNGSTATNPIYKFYTSRDYFGASESLHEKLTERNDPRDAVYFVAHPKGSDGLVFAPNGLANFRQSYYGISGIMSAANPLALQSYHEICFLKAEAHIRLNNNTTDAETELKKGIAASFVKVGLTAQQAEDYYTANVKSRFDTNPLNEIMLQKYLASYEDESLEAYHDYRRMKAMGNGNYLTLKNPNPFPLRYTYGDDDVSTNPNVEVAQGDGQFVRTENVWWAGGTR